MGLRKSWFRNGKLRDSGNYIEGKQDGAWAIYYENGNMQMSAGYKMGRIDGTVTNWYEEGMLMSTKEYKDGLPDGTFKFYKKSSREPIDVMKFKEGKRVED